MFEQRLRENSEYELSCLQNCSSRVPEMNRRQYVEHYEEAIYFAKDVLRACILGQDAMYLRQDLLA